MKIRHKLWLSLLVFVALFSLFSFLLFIHLRQLNKLLLQEAELSSELVLIGQAAEKPEKLYLTLSDALIVKDKDASNKMWLKANQAITDDLAKLATITRNSEEQTQHKQLETLFAELSETVENRLLPQLFTQAETQNMADDMAMDGMLDDFSLEEPAGDEMMLDDFSDDTNLETPDDGIQDDWGASEEADFGSTENIESTDDWAIEPENTGSTENATDPTATDDFWIAESPEGTANSNTQDLFQEVSGKIAQIETTLSQWQETRMALRAQVQAEYNKVQKNMMYLGIIFWALVILTVFVFVMLFYRSIVSPMRKITNTLDTVSQGNFEIALNFDAKDEVGQMAKALNKLTTGLNETAGFAKQIEQGNFSSDFQPLGKNDVLGNALLDMRQSLEQSVENEKKRKEEDEKRNWANQGVAKFGDVLRQTSDDVETLSHAIIKNLVLYLNANQGGIFILNDEDKNNIFLELTSAFAYNRRKYFERSVKIGEGLVGTAAVEKETIYMTEIPDNYIEITSGLGTSNPRSLLIVPLKLDQQVLGVVEIASFNRFGKHEIEFVEKIAENIASALSSTKVSQRTARLLEQSRQQAEEMAAQEEEMRQNMEELQATQEEAARQAAELEGTFAAINETLGALEYDLNGQFTDANEFWLNRLQLTRDEVIGKHLSTFAAAEEKKNHIEFDKLWAKLKDGQTITQQHSYQAKNSKEKVWFRETYKPMRDAHGNIYKILAICIDITEVKMQQQELQQKAEELAKTHEAMKQRQKELEVANTKMQQNEVVLKKALQKAKKIEDDLKVKNEEMLAQEEEMQQSLEELTATQEEMEKNIENLQEQNQQKDQTIAELREKLS